MLKRLVARQKKKKTSQATLPGKRERISIASAWGPEKTTAFAGEEELTKGQGHHRIWKRIRTYLTTREERVGEKKSLRFL